MLKCLIVDDDAMARAAIKRLVTKHDELEVTDIFDGAMPALEFLSNKKNKIDLLLLDVEMPEMTGIELLEKLPTVPLVIFTTSKADYAFDAFEYGAVDFLKKPITKPRFEQAIDKVLQIQQSNQEFQADSSRMFVRSEGKYVGIDCDEILYFENVGDYVKIHVEGGKGHIIHGTLKNIAERLNDPRFLKVHRSFIVNLNHIVDIEENTLVINRAVIPISRAHRSVLMGRLRIL